MKLHGEAIDVTAKAQMTLPRVGEVADIVFTIEALPLGLEEKAERYFPNPTVPMGYAKKPNGGLLRDPRTKKPQLVEQLSDPSYKKASSLANRRQMLYFLYFSLHRGGDITFDVEAPHDTGALKLWEDFTDALFVEFQKSGFSMGDFVIMVDKIMDVSNMSGEAIEEAKEAFLSQLPG